jgi:hypothetical protein
MKRSLLVSLVMLTFLAKAEASLDPMYFGIGSVEVQELPENEIALEATLKEGTESVSAATEIWFEKAEGGGGQQQPQQAPRQAGNRSAEPIDTEALGEMLGMESSEVGIFLRVGKEIWRIIEENQPVMNTSYNTVSVLPKEVTEWNQMEAWQTPKSSAYQVIYKNLYGIEVIRFSYRLNYTYGGKFNGAGQYLSNVAVSPIHVRVLWGFTLDADVAVKNISNTGSLASPVPGVEVQVNYSVSTIFTKEENAEVFYVRGDGYSKKLN